MDLLDWGLGCCHAAESMCSSSLKTVDVGEFTAALLGQAKAWKTLRWFYGGKTFASVLGRLAALSVRVPNPAAIHFFSAQFLAEEYLDK